MECGAAEVSTCTVQRARVSRGEHGWGQCWHVVLSAHVVRANQSTIMSSSLVRLTSYLVNNQMCRTTAIIAVRCGAQDACCVRCMHPVCAHHTTTDDGSGATTEHLVTVPPRTSPKRTTATVPLIKLSVENSNHRRVFSTCLVIEVY